MSARGNEISEEQKRILVAAHERRYGQNENGRYIITADYLNERERASALHRNGRYLHDARPNRQERQKLEKRGMLKFRVEGEDSWWEPSARGYQALYEAGFRPAQSGPS